MASLKRSILFTACLVAATTAQSPSASQLVPFQRLFSSADDINFYTTSDADAASMNAAGYAPVTPGMGCAVKLEEIDAVRVACPNVTFAPLKRVAIDSGMGCAVKLEEIDAVRVACPNVTFAPLKRVAIDSTPVAYRVMTPFGEEPPPPPLLGYGTFTAGCGATLPILEYQRFPWGGNTIDFIYVVALSPLHAAVAADTRYRYMDTVFYLWST